MTFEFNGINHLALVCKDMDVTVDFYCNTLGMKLTKTIELSGGTGKHYFFDAGGDDAVAFFWFPNAPEGVPGISRHQGYDDDMQRTGRMVAARLLAQHDIQPV